MERGLEVVDAAVAYGPSQVDTVVNNGVRVRVNEETEYPFRGEVHLTVNPASNVEFPLVLRIPAWAEGSVITVNGHAVEGVRAGEFHRLKRSWKRGDQVALRFPMRVRASRSYHNSVVLERELRRRGHKAAREVRIPVYYLGELVCYQSVDLLVDDRVIIENKTGERLREYGQRLGNRSQFD